MKYELKGDYIGGEYYFNKKPDGTIEKYSPADLDNHLWTINYNFQHVDKAINAVNDGFKKWRKTELSERIQFLNKYKEALIDAKDEIAEAIAFETGKPLWESLTEAGALISKVDVTINHSLTRIETERYEELMAKTNGHVHYKPLGPTLIIGPFNFPCHLANGQILSALIAGNTIIFKPSEKTAYSTQLMIDCFHKADLPAGVVNLIQGGGDMASRLIKESSIKGIHFTGSKEVGLKILSATQKDLSKLVALELGGKNTSIIHKDAKVDHAMSELLKACFLTAGQRCTSTSIVAIHRSLAQEFVEKFHSLAKRLIIDHPTDFKDTPFMGPLIDGKAVEAYLLFMGMAKREGFEEIMRGKVISKDFKGHYVSPSIHFADKPNFKSLFLQSEIFGPNCTFIPYDSIEEAIEIANMTEYGLSSAIFTEDHDLFEQCIDDIDVGIFNMNRSTVGANSTLPFGGVKSSGNHRPAAVTTIDSCVYKQANLEVIAEDDVDFKSITGLNWE